MIMKMLDKGALHISEDVFAIITSIVINEIDGIASTVSDLKDDFIRVVHKKGNQRGIAVHQNDNELYIDVKVSVYLGENILEVCKQLQKQIIAEIKIMTGIEVTGVNVIVDSVRLKDEN
ncbi:Asp23/Gls24 family envelope stress response protein [Calidifontibacillus erzurumensis]|uniref:Asp23/Gls24 family envelope stress response protein n=1 Tax=Calidifontibacillus erzurumensis TaxID=2741433 RepID=A0A8J8GBR5_9BACI|nr:Asp23/Gls24 family envelope stress response protein [Calidifontibacillus erzurumensis]NSL50747.1 Asp23/Gls24 family envelope stress response protein [Calidifontibacillus erzurumensis]